MDSDSSELDHERRAHERFSVSISVDYQSRDTFLFSYITNISEMGIFIRTEEPLDIGTELVLRFGPDDGDQLAMKGVVAWINPLRPKGINTNPGMGIQFHSLTAELRERLVELVRTIAYLHDFRERN